MEKDMDFTNVPYLEELLSYLPMNSMDKEDVNTYLQSIIESILVNYDGEQYQFAYFGMHLLYMTYIYFSVRKISVIIPERYRDAVVFAKPYHGKTLNFHSLESAFDYSLVAEKELPNILQLIGLDAGQIVKIGYLVDSRNEMAHASGRFAIINEDTFYASTNRIWDSVKNIHTCMDKQIRKWFADFLLRYCNKEFAEYNEITDIIEEQMIQDFSLSVQELLVCNTMSIKSLISEKSEFKSDLNDFKRTLKKYCEDQGLIN